MRDGRRQRVQLGAVALTLGLGVATFGAAFDAYQNLEKPSDDVEAAAAGARLILGT